MIMKLLSEMPAGKTETRTVSAYDFGAPLTRDDDNVLMFGTHGVRTAKTLRELADRIEKGEVIITSARVLTLAKQEDFTNSVLRLVFSEQVKLEPEKGKEEGNA
jgi:hypothetical protein